MNNISIKDSQIHSSLKGIWSTDCLHPWKLAVVDNFSDPWRIFLWILYLYINFFNNNNEILQRTFYKVFCNVFYNLFKKLYTPQNNLSKIFGEQNCRKSDLMPKILSVENFCPPKVLSAEIFCPLKSKTCKINKNLMLKHIF